jgi:hypothetical protein
VLPGPSTSEYIRIWGLSSPSYIRAVLLDLFDHDEHAGSVRASRPINRTRRSFTSRTLRCGTGRGSGIAARGVRDASLQVGGGWICCARAGDVNPDGANPVARARNSPTLGLPRKGAYWFRLTVGVAGRMPRNSGWPRKIRRRNNKRELQRRTRSRGLISRDAHRSTPARPIRDDSRLALRGVTARGVRSFTWTLGPAGRARSRCRS